MAKPLVFEIIGDASKAVRAFEDFEGKAAGAAAGVAAAFAAVNVGQNLADGLAAEETYAKLGAQFSGAEGAAGKAGSVAASVYAGAFGESIDEVAASVRSVGERMVDLSATGEPELQKLTEGAMSIAEVFDEDVNSVTRAAGQLMKNGLAKDGQEALDIIARGFQDGLNVSDDFLDTLTEYSEPLNQLGIDGETALGMFRAGVDSGAYSVDKIGDAVNEFAIRSIDGSTGVAEAFQVLGLDADDMAKKLAGGGEPAKRAFSEVVTALGGVGDAVAQDKAGVALFGSMWEDAGKGMVLSLDPAAAAAVSAQGSAQQLADTMGGTNAATVESWRRNIDGWVQGMAQSPGPVGLAVASVTEFSSEITSGASALGSMVLAVRSHRAATALSAAATTAQGTATRGAAVAQGSLSAALWASPLTWIAAVIIGVGAALYLAYTRSETFRDGVNRLGTGIKNAFGSAGEWINDMITKLTDAPGKIVRFFSGIGGTVKSGFHSALSGVATLWNATVAKAGFTAPSWIPGIGGNSWSIPEMTVPALAKGGIATAPTLALIGEAGPEAVVPLDRGREFGWGSGPRAADVHVTVQVDGQTLLRALKRAELRSA